MTSSTPPFERLEQAVTMIAQHTDYPGKVQVVAECLDEIEDRWQQRQLTLEQRFRLYAILMERKLTSRSGVDRLNRMEHAQ